MTTETKEVVISKDFLQAQETQEGTKREEPDTSQFDVETKVEQEEYAIGSEALLVAINTILSKELNKIVKELGTLSSQYCFPRSSSKTIRPIHLEEYYLVLIREEDKES
eukprot:2306735-Amphidinium_carterae.1